jgi:quinolinate synthase
MSLTQIQREIVDLKKRKDVTILSHYYQPIEIQQVADYLGDSLGLSRTAKNKTETNFIIFAGVDFMAETASILNQEKHVLLPNRESCCPMAAFLTAKMVRVFKEEYPKLPVITYVNSTAEVKAESDVCCTSSNSIKIVKHIAKEYNTDSVLFGPDANLADYAEEQTGIKTIKMPENGHCHVHSHISISDVNTAKKAHKAAILLVHPECTREVRNSSDFVGSTAQMYNKVKDSPENEEEFIIGTEEGLIERMKEDFPNKNFYPLQNKMICYNMKKNTLELIKYVLEHLNDPQFEIKVPSDIAQRALVPIERMLRYS